MSKTIYCGSGKKKSDTWIKATINPDIISEHIQEYEGKKFVKLNININEEPDQYGKDVKITIDTWEPEDSEAVTPSSAKEDLRQENDVKIEDIPF